MKLNFGMWLEIYSSCVCVCVWGGALTGPQLLEGVAGKDGVTFFRRGGCNFHIKNKLKSEIISDKKSL